MNTKYTWNKLMRMTKLELLAEAQKLGSTVDSLTTRSKADLADYVIWLADHQDDPGYVYEEFTHEESPIIGEYLDGCNALLHRSADGYRISTAEEDIEFKTADEVIAFMKETIAEWEKVSAR